VFPEPISQAGIPGGAIVFVGALVVILTYGVWYVNTSENGFLAELISAVPDRLARLADEKSKLEQAAPAPEPIRKDPGPKTESETQSAAPAEPEKTPRVAEPATSAPAFRMTDQATPEPEKALEKVAEKALQAAPASEPKPDAQTPAETEKKPGTEEAPEQQAAAWEPPPGVVKPPESPPAPQPVAPQPAAPAEVAPATASVGASVSGSVPVSVGATSPAAPETRIAPPTRTPEPVHAPTVVPMDMIPSVPASPRPQAQAATVAPEAAAPEASVAASTSAAASAREETPEVQSAAETPAREAPAAPAAGGAGRIVVKAKTNSWIQVRDDAAGELVLTRMLMSGDGYIVPDRSGLTLSTGNAGALEILVDGEPVPAVGGEGTVRRRIVLDAERLKSGTAVRE
jgi:cytoskeleton protein RodZ